MGGVVESIGDAISDVGQTIGTIAQDTVQAVEGAASSVGHVLEQVGQAAVNDPIGTIAKVAAVATGQLYLLPAISAVDVLAHGGDLGQAALSAGISYAGMGIASGVSDMLASGAESTLTSVETGADGSTVYNYSDGSTMTQTAGGETTFTNPTTITGPLNAAISNAAASAATNLAVTGDVTKALTAGLTSGAGTYVGGEITDATGSKLAGTIGGALTKGAITGKDPTANIVNNIISTTLSQAGSQIKSAWNDVNSIADKYNQQFAQTKDMLDSTVVPAQKEAQAAQDTAKASYDEYKVQADKFADLQKQYDDAKAAGNADLANSLADQANAMIPTLNAATDKYNTDAATYQTKLDTFNASNSKLADAASQLDTIKSDYTAKNDLLNKESTALTDAATKVAAMSPDAQKAFTSIYGNGTDVTTALDTSTKVNDMSTIAQSTFTRNYNSSNDLTASLDIANQVNNLSTTDQTAYKTAITTGLDDASAIKVAPNISGLDERAQNVYLDSLKSGQDEKTATINATLAQLFGQQDTTPTSAPVDNTAVASANTTGSVTDAGAGPTTPVVTDPNTPKGTVTVSSPPPSFDPNTPPVDANAPAADTTPVDPYAAGKDDPAYQEYLAQFQGGTNPDGSIRPAIDMVPATYDAWKQDVANPQPIADQPPAPGGPGLASETPAPSTGDGTAPSTGSGGSGVDLGKVYNAIGSGSGTTTAPSSGGGQMNTLPVKTTAPATAPATPWTLPAITAPVVGGATTTAPATTTTSALQQSPTGGIQNLTPGLTQRMDYNLTGIPNIQETSSPEPNFASGGSTGYDPFAAGSSGDSVSSGLYKSLTPGLTKAQINYILTGLPGAAIQSHAEGGEIGPEGHNPTFFSEGGLNAMDNRYVQGEGDGTSDSVAAMLANGEFVIPADVVSKLGNGSNEAGASVLDQFLKVVRKDANSNGEELPPKSKGPLAYLLDAKRTMKA
jgi:hypothetical protein